MVEIAVILGVALFIGLLLILIPTRFLYKIFKPFTMYTFGIRYIRRRRDHVDTYTEHKDGKMHYDKIRLHFIYGFTLDRLAGITLQVKTNARYLTPS